MIDLANDPRLKLHFAYKVHKENDDREPLAKFIESGGDLSNLDEEQREILAHFVRTGKRRKYEKVPPITRNKEICEHLAYLGGLGHGKTECMNLAAEKFDLSVSTIKSVWSNRGKSLSLRIHFLTGQADRVAREIDAHVKAKLSHEELYGALRPSVDAESIAAELSARFNDYELDLLTDYVRYAIVECGWIEQEGGGEVTYKPAT